MTRFPGGPPPSDAGAPGTVDAEAVVQAAGWYPDPFGRGPFRWWDGERWSEYAGDGRDVVWDAVPTEEAAALSPGLRGAGVALIGALLGLALSFGISAWLHAADEPGGRTAELGLSQLGLWVGLIGACVYVSHRRGTGSLVEDFGFRFRWGDLGLGLAGALAGRIVAGLALAPIPFPSRSLNEVDRSVLQDATDSSWGWVVLILLTCVGAPLVEELFFRGLLQTRLVGRFGPVAGIVGASLVFGAAHLIAWDGLMTLAYGWSIAGGGLVLGMMRHYSGRLGPPIVAHAFFNAVAMIALATLT